MTSQQDLSQAFIYGYYFNKFMIYIKSIEWDERYEFFRAIYNDKHPEAPWEERSDQPVQDMIEYAARKEYVHFFWMGFTVNEDGTYIVHEKIRYLMHKIKVNA